MICLWQLPVVAVVCIACLSAVTTSNDIHDCSDMHWRMSAQPTGHVLNGIPVNSANELPWQARVEARGFICGATIIHSQYLLTAGHCVHFQKKGSYEIEVIAPSMVKIVVGSLFITGLRTEGQRTLTAQRIFVHRNFSYYAKDYDYAIIRLPTPLNFTDNIKPICIPKDCAAESNGMISRDLCLVSGWGISKVSSALPTNQLQKAIVPLVPAQICEPSLQESIERFRLTDQMLCAGYPGGIDTCQGDSGGPLICRSSSADNKYILIGITSFGSPLCGTSYGVYARVCKIVPWINSVIQPERRKRSAPFHVKISVPGGRNCSGAIVDKRWIITSASCVPIERRNQRRMNVTTSDGTSLGRVRRVKIHGQYDNTSFANNFALLKLRKIQFRGDEDLRFPDKISVPQSCNSLNQPGDCETAGWGGFSGKSFRSLQSTNVKYKRRSSCTRLLGNDYANATQLICVRKESPKQAPCQADEGSPMVCRKRRNGQVLQGLASFVKGPCGHRSSVVVYSRICSVGQWILENIRRRRN